MVSSIIPEQETMHASNPVNRSRINLSTITIPLADEIFPSTKIY